MSQDIVDMEVMHLLSESDLDGAGAGWQSIGAGRPPADPQTATPVGAGVTKSAIASTGTA